MYLSIARQAANVAGILFLTLQTALCLPPDLPQPPSPVIAEGVATRHRAERLREQGRLGESERLLSDFIARHAADAPGPVLAHFFNDLGVLCQDQRRFPEALRHYNASVDQWEKLGPKYRLHAATSLNNLATVLWDDGRLTDAYKALVRSANLQVQIAGPFSPALAPLYYNQGVLSLALNRLSEAEDGFARFLRIGNPTIDSPYLLRASLVHSDLGWIATRKGRSEDAAQHFERSRQLWAQWRTETPDQHHPAILDPVLLLNLAASLGRAGSLLQAAEAVHLAISAMDATTGSTHPKLVDALQLNAKILRGLKRKAAARASELRAKQILQSMADTPAGSNARIDIAALQSAAVHRRESGH